MPLDAFTNFAQTTLTTAVTTTPAAGTVETWTVASTASFAQIGTAGTAQFRLTCGPSTDTSPEVVIVEEILSSTQLSVSRGAEGSTIKTHAAGTELYQTVTAGTLNTFRFMTQTITSSQNVTAPIWATVADVTLIGGGGGGGGGGSANSSTASPAGISNQPGGAGGGAGVTSKATFSVTPGDVYAVTRGAGGVGGAGGAAAASGGTGNNGNGGTAGGNSSFAQGSTTLLEAYGGNAGQGSNSNSTATAYGGTMGGSWYANASRTVLAGDGGPAGNPYSPNPGPPVQGVFGGWGSNGTASATVGGAAISYTPPVAFGASSPFSSVSASGPNGVSPSNTPSNLYGYGGNGGGGGAPGGAGGNGGNGAPGVCIITWRSQ